MSTERVRFGDDPAVEIETSRINLVFNRDHRESTYLERIPLEPNLSLEHYRRLDKIDPFAAALFKIVVPDFDGEVTKESLDKCSFAFQQLAGLMSLTVTMIALRKKFVWKYPESGLHPRYQANLADVIILLSNPEAFEKFVKGVRRDQRN